MTAATRPASRLHCQDFDTWVDAFRLTVAVLHCLGDRLTAPKCSRSFPGMPADLAIVPGSTAQAAQMMVLFVTGQPTMLFILHERTR